VEHFEAKQFAMRWEIIARARRFPADPSELAPPMTVAELRRLSMEFFSMGGVYHAALSKRLITVLGDAPESSLLAMTDRPQQ